MKKKILERLSSGPDALIEEFVSLYQKINETIAENEALKSRISILEMNATMRDQLLSLPQVDDLSKYPKELDLDATDPIFNDAGFYHIEKDHDGRAYRWSNAKGVIFIRTKLNREIELSFNLFVNGIHESVDANSIYYAIDGGSWLPVQIVDNKLTGTIPASNSPNVVVRIKHDTLSTYTSDTEGDKRNLGITMSSVNFGVL